MDDNSNEQSAQAVVDAADGGSADAAADDDTADDDAGTDAPDYLPPRLAEAYHADELSQDVLDAYRDASVPERVADAYSEDDTGQDVLAAYRDEAIPEHVADAYFEGDTSRDVLDVYRDTNVPGHVADAYRAFTDHPHVETVTVNATRAPPRLELALATGSITPGLSDLLAQHHASVEYADCDVADGGLYIEAAVEVPPRDAGLMSLRKHGPSSIVITLTREALELSGFAEGDKVSLTARDDEIRLEAWD